MYRKWKKAAALGLAVLIGGMMPTSTMLAAEEDAAVVQELEADAGSEAGAVSDAEIISDDNESVVDEASADDENVGDEVNADDENTGDELNADDESVDDEGNADDAIVDEQNAGKKVMSASDAAEAGDAEVQENTDAPVINITLNGESCKVDGLGGGIDYKYTNVPNSTLGFSASLNGTPIMFCYWLDESPGDEAKDNIPWSGKCTAMEWTLSSNKSYVVYVKAEKDGQTVYARSCGIVVDTTAPEIVGVKEGETYPAGTTFTVSDANLDVVRINETPAAPEQDGSYRVRANGTSCMIRAIDKAGNEKTCSITVTGGEPEEDPKEDTVISESKVYTLKAGVKYHLAAGNWKIDGDQSVYQGDNDFYVKKDGDYNFSK